jgi:DNA-binding protein
MGRKKEKSNRKLKNIGKNIKTNIKYKIDTKVMSKIIKPKNKSVGHSGVINEMMKYSRGTTMENVIINLMQTIICTGKKPVRNYVGRVIPVIKNNQLSNEMLSKIRSITISETISNILENYLLERINIDIKGDKFQFAFTSKSSTQHALYTFKETVSYYLKQRERIYTLVL